MYIIQNLHLKYSKNFIEKSGEFCRKQQFGKKKPNFHKYYIALDKACCLK